MRCRKYPEMAVRINRDDRVVMGIASLLVQQYRRSRARLGRVVKAGNHVQQFSIVVFLGASITEKRFVDLFAINREGAVFGAIRSQSTAVFVHILIIGRLIHVPDAAISIRFLIQRNGLLSANCSVLRSYRFGC